jgi:hypothetical protein
MARVFSRSAGLHRALDLALVREKQPDNGLVELDDALKVLKEALAKHPNDHDLSKAQSASAKRQPSLVPSRAARLERQSSARRTAPVG